MGYAFVYVVDFAKVTVFYLLLVNSVNTRKQLRRLIWLMVLGGLFPALGALRNFAIGHIEEGRAGWIGIFQNPNELAYGLVLLVPLAAYLASTTSFFKATLLWLIVMTYIAGIAVSFSRGGVLGLLAVLGMLGLKWKNSTGRVLTIMLLVASLIFIGRGWSRTEGFTQLGGDSGVQSRLQTIRAGLAMFADHPITGVGPGCSVVAWPIYAPANIHEKWLVIHNSFIQALAETGIFGFLCFTLLFVIGIYDCRKIAREKTGDKWKDTSQMAGSIELSLWGFVVCGMSGGFALSWVPYLFIGLVSALKKVVEGDPSAAFAE